MAKTIDADNVGEWLATAARNEVYRLHDKITTAMTTLGLTTAGATAYDAAPLDDPQYFTVNESAVASWIDSIEPASDDESDDGSDSADRDLLKRYALTLDTRFPA